MYPRPESSPLQSQVVSGQKKVDVVCDALRKAMEAMDANKSVMFQFSGNLLIVTVRRANSRRAIEQINMESKKY